MIEEFLSDAEARMKKSVEALREELVTLRTGRASPALVEHLMVDYYGVPTPLIQIAGITAPEPRLLVIQPWDISALKEIERAILTSDLGLTPTTDGRVIRLAIPYLTEERRRELVKRVRQRVEACKVALRNIRRDTIEDLEEAKKEKLISEDDLFRAKDDLQKLTEKYYEAAEKVGEAKEKEIMEV
ncbi:MAG: ribosome recycling factor [Chloroflexia bacterium]